MRILIADDSDLVRRGIVRVLSVESGWTVCGEARDGLEAIQKAQELLPDLILLDISMPGMSGLEVARRLRVALPKVKLVIVSQHDTALMLPRVIEAGGDACLDKACLAADLVTTIRALN
jgi:DNA-binding NarL/FixJ family response regulator